MSNPYRILGVSPSASDRAVRRAYRKKKRLHRPQKYHDDQLAEFSKAQFDEIAKAYQKIQAERKDNPVGRFYGNAERMHASDVYMSELLEIREMLLSEDASEQLMTDAEERLKRIPIEGQNAEWHFLMGCLLYQKCYFIDGQIMLRQACKLDPKNEEYQIKLEAIKEKAKKYYKKSSAPFFRSGDCAEGCVICSCEACCEGCCEGICEAGCDC